MDFRQIIEKLNQIEEARMGAKELSKPPTSKMTFGFEVEVGFIPYFDEDQAREEAKTEAKNDDKIYVSDYDIWNEIVDDDDSLKNVIKDYLTPLYGYAKVEDVISSIYQKNEKKLKMFFSDANLANSEDDAQTIINKFKYDFHDEFLSLINKKNKSYLDILSEFVNNVKENYVYDENKDYGDEINEYWVYDDEEQSDITKISDIYYGDLEDYFDGFSDLEEYLNEEASNKTQENINEYIEKRVEEMKTEYIDDENSHFHFQDAANIFENGFDTEYSIDINDDPDPSKDTDSYTIEPDSSIGIGIEIVSPVFDDYNEFLSELELVFDWISERDDFETTNATGLHINIGMKNMVDDIDILKLLLFMGEAHVAKEFGRLYNNYTMQTLDTVKSIIKDKPTATYKDSIEVINLNLLKQSEKYSTVNIGKLYDKDYIEFRVMGGKDYHLKWNKIKNTIGRFVRIIEIANDPSAYRKDYIKKLSKLLQGVDPRALMKMKSDVDLGEFPVSVISKIRSFFSKYVSPRQMTAFGNGYYSNKYAFIEQLISNRSAIEDLQNPETRTIVRDIINDINKYSTDNENTVNYYTTNVNDMLTKLPDYPDAVKFIKSVL
jgi:hypothetical protein